ncbi:hypothetical protein DMUE_0023 [Dictyocoela muelleri]|nr:hypothetical protein DMUE_0023 [Dictyocoela muelleri]
MNYNEIPKKKGDKIFSSIENSLNYLIDENLSDKVKICRKCTNDMFIQKDASYVDKHIFRCSNIQCRIKEGLFSDSILAIPQKPINNKLLAIYEWLARDFQKIISNDTEMAISTFQKIRQTLLKYLSIKYETKKDMVLGGEHSVQIDETVIYKGTLITSPSNLYDEIKGLTWLVGIIERHTERMIIKIV